MIVKESTRIGTHHLNTREENQDVICHAQNQDFCIISLADGVSSCKEAKKGAEIACSAVTNLLLKKGDAFFDTSSGQISESILSHILYQLNQCAAESSSPVEEYSSTLSTILLDKKRKRFLCFHLGDGLILGTQEGKCRVLAMPCDSSSGCCVTTTRQAETMVTVRIMDADLFDSVLICSDGAWRAMYKRNRLKPDVFHLLVNHEFNKLEEFLAQQNCFDDYSFISLDLRHASGGISA